MPTSPAPHDEPDKPTERETAAPSPSSLPAESKAQESAARAEGGDAATDDDEIEIEFAEAIADDSDEPLEITEFVDDDQPVEAASATETKDAKPPEAPPAPKPPEPPPPPKQLVLIGAGHAHLQLLTWWRRRPIKNVELTLVTAFDRAVYSSMLPSTLADMYPRDTMMIDLPKLCEVCGVRLIVDRANRLDPETNLVMFAHQPALYYDVASINIGSVPADEPLWQAHRILISVKPLGSFVQRFEVRFRELVEQWRAAPGPELLQIVIVGAGAAGVELALCLEQHKHELELPADVRLVDGNAEILPGSSPKTTRLVHKLLKLRGIDLHLGSPVIDCDDEGPSSLVLENGKRVRADLVIWAAGASPPMALRGFELPKSARGFLATRRTLQTTADFPIFISGDAADIEGTLVPKAGVYAVRQAPILWKNLKRHFAGKPLVDYRPQKGFLSLMSCGDGTAILDYKGFTSHSAWAWMLKDWIDRRWIKRFRVR